MLKKELNLKRFLLNLFAINFIIVFLFCVFNIVFSVDDLAYAILEISLVGIIFLLTTIYYERYNEPHLLMRMKINRKTKEGFKTKIFLLITFYGIVAIICYFGWLYLFDVTGFAASNFGEPDKTHYLNWSELNIFALVIMAMIEILCLQVFSYFVNHFALNRGLALGIQIIIFVYLLFFGNVLSWYAFYYSPNNGVDYYLSWQSDSFKLRILFNTLIFPWTLIGIFGKALIIIPKTANVHWFDFSYMNARHGTTYMEAFNVIKLFLIAIPIITFIIPNIHGLTLKKQ